MLRFSLDINEQLQHVKDLNLPQGYVLIPPEFFNIKELGLDEDCLLPNCRSVWEAIQFFTNEYGSCIHSVQAIAEKAGISTSTYYRCIDVLKENCLITVEERYDPITNARQTNRIFCNHPLLAAQLKNNSTPSQYEKREFHTEQQDSLLETSFEQSEKSSFQSNYSLIKNDTPPSHSERQTDVMYVYKKTTDNNTLKSLSQGKNKFSLPKPVQDIFSLFVKSGISIDIHKKSIEVIRKYMLNLSESDREKVINSLKEYQDAGKIKNAAAWFLSKPDLVIEKALTGELNTKKNKEKESFYQDVIFFPDKIEKKEVIDDSVSLLTINEVKEILNNLHISEEVFLKNTPTIKSINTLVSFSSETIKFMAKIAKEREQEKKILQQTV